MPRDLADVLHYFLPELEDESNPESDRAASADDPARATPTRPIPAAPNARVAFDERLAPGMQPMGVPIGDRDVVRAALVWNLAVEIARLGRGAVVLAPESKAQTPLWPEPGIGPLGAEMRFCAATNLAELEAAADELSRKLSSTPAAGRGMLFVHVPPSWLDAEAAVTDVSIRGWLLMSAAHHGHLAEAHRLASAIRKGRPDSNVGVTIHGVSNVQQARQAYEHLSRLCVEAPGIELSSYGLLVDDLDVYRAIAAQRPIGLEHPQAPATRALMDVARLLAEDIGSPSLG